MFEFDHNVQKYVPVNIVTASFNTIVGQMTNVSAKKTGQIIMECGVVGKHYETSYFHPQHWHLPSQNGSAKNSMSLA